MLPMTSRTARLLLALPLFSATMIESADAQVPSPGAAAEAVVRSAFEAMDAKRWMDAAALVDPDALSRFRDWRIEHVREMERMRSTPPEQRYGPDTPPEVVAWFEEKRAKAEEAERRSGFMLPGEFARVESLEELEALSPKELFARYLEARDPREQFEQARKAAGRELPGAVVKQADAAVQAQRTVIGSTVENDSTVYVVYRTRLGNRPWEEPDRIAVTTVRRTPQGWRMRTGAHDEGLFSNSFGFAVSFPAEEDVRAHLEELAKTVVEWSPEGGGTGRLSLSGYTGGTQPPKALAVEVTRPDGTRQRIEIPSAVFPDLALILMAWPEGQ
jgi:hypothetical protein